jgi:hypothetical protein
LGVAGIFLFAVGGLLVAHISMILSNETTIESMEKVNPIRSDIVMGGSNPFDLGWEDNVKEVFGDSLFWCWLPVHTSLGDGVTFRTRL